MSLRVVTIDSEFTRDGSRLTDLGAVDDAGGVYHGKSLAELRSFLAGSAVVAGHNIADFDAPRLAALGLSITAPIADTLYLSALLFPKKPYHKLVKDDKIVSEELNNPVADAQKSYKLLCDAIAAFARLPQDLQIILRSLAGSHPALQGFFLLAGSGASAPVDSPQALAGRIARFFAGSICEHADLGRLIAETPLELAYALALIATGDRSSVTPAWVLHRLSAVETVIDTLCRTPCREGCAYCSGALDVKSGLKRIFGFENFRLYAGEPLQEMAAAAAMRGESLLAIFPTGGGKSLTFQLPALMASQANRGLTVVISPLQSLMKDQVDHLIEAGITEAVTINGMLDPVERAKAFELVVNGTASLLYISPESLRSKTMERALSSRHIERFVIDEAHCFSAWGHDFRVDYLFIADFIAKLVAARGGRPIAVSCFTATAKQKVISDIREYFKERLGLNLTLYATHATRTNLHYAVIEVKDDEEKYARLRELVLARPCPTIVYTSSVADTHRIAAKLTDDGLEALAYNGPMDSAQKAATQEAFIEGRVNIIVATNAFGMGVDKKDIGLVVHYSISASLENYVQEAGRGARDPGLEAECCVLFCEADLERHFQLINNTRLTLKEIKDVWRGIKELSRRRSRFSSSALELARAAGWSEEALEDSRALETKIRSALAALEDAGYIKRDMNAPRVFATSIAVKSLEEGKARIAKSPAFSSEAMRVQALRILGSLISSQHRSAGDAFEAESRVDYLADRLGIAKSDVVAAVLALRMAGILKDDSDMSAQIAASRRKPQAVLEAALKLEGHLIGELQKALSARSFEGADVLRASLKEINTRAVDMGVASSVKDIRTIFYYWRITGLVTGIANAGGQCVEVSLAEARKSMKSLAAGHEARKELCSWLVQTLSSLEPERAADEVKNAAGDKSAQTKTVNFSLVGLYVRYKKENLFAQSVRVNDIKDALLFLSRIGALALEGGFVVLYNAMTIERLISDNRIQYRKEDYGKLDAYYQQKIQQVHIVGRYVSLLTSDYDQALRFVKDYFELDYKLFVKRYFADPEELERPVTASIAEKITGGLSEVQQAIVTDKTSPYIAVAAGPGSGKTRILVHKIAALLLLEGVKREQLLALTFSRAAATVFKERLIELVGSAAHYTPIKTFHSFAFDLLGRIGNLDEAQNVVDRAAEMIENHAVEPARIAKSVLVLDEAQDMNESDYRLVTALLRHNPDMRVIAVGDDDQNVYEFRGSNPRYFRNFSEHERTRLYEMPENWRSAAPIVAVANVFAATIKNRMKHTALEAMRTDAGLVRVIDYQAANLALPIVKAVAADLARASEGANAQGPSTAILTRTNEEACEVYGALLEAGIRARLIEASRDFALSNLLEARAYLAALDQMRKDSPTLPHEACWQALESVRRRYGRENRAVAVVAGLVETFLETAPPESVYYSDLVEFIRESRFEDIKTDGPAPVIVSTIHKAKGTEFDRVHLWLRSGATNDEERRAVFVGITRARTMLVIHENTPVFSSLLARKGIPSVEITRDSLPYAHPRRLVLHLSLKDVNLGFFKGKKRFIGNIATGAALAEDPSLPNAFLVETGQGQKRRALVLAKAAAARVEALKAAGYVLSSAQAGWIVAWKDKERNIEEAVLLPWLEFAKSGEPAQN